MDKNSISRDLLQQIAEGDEGAFSFFYHHYYHELQPIAWRCVESGIDPKEVLQITFMKAWLNRQRLPEIGNLKAWLIKVAYREYLTAIRKKLTYEEKLAEFSAGSSEGVPATPFHVVNYNELKRYVQEVIQSLSPQRKVIFEMSRNQGLKIDEIADRLSISPNTVKSVLQTVLKLIRERLTEAGYGPFVFLFFFTIS